MNEEDFSVVQGITLAVIISLVFWASIIFGVMLWES